MIQHLKHHDIDKNIWDMRISESHNELPYAYSWVLDILAPEWEALIDDNYNAILPFVHKKKLFINYIVSPIFIQQLGLFTNTPASPQTIDNFIKAFPYNCYRYNLNEQNKTSMSVKKQPNFVLDISPSYEQLYLRYSTNTKRNIKKALKNSLSITENISVCNFLNLYYENQILTRKNKEKIKNIVEQGIANKKGKIIGVYKDNSLIAAVFLLLSKKRLVYYLPVSNAEGKATSAMFLLVDYIIRKKECPLLDFEGSKIEGVARFYKGFGATLQYYFIVKKNFPDWFFRIRNILKI